MQKYCILIILMDCFLSLLLFTLKKIQLALKNPRCDAVEAACQCETFNFQSFCTSALNSLSTSVSFFLQIIQLFMEGHGMCAHATSVSKAKLHKESFSWMLHLERCLFLARSPYIRAHCMNRKESKHVPPHGTSLYKTIQTSAAILLQIKLKL